MPTEASARVLACSAAPSNQGRGLPTSWIRSSAAAGLAPCGLLESRACIGHAGLGKPTCRACQGAVAEPHCTHDNSSEAFANPRTSSKRAPRAASSAHPHRFGETDAPCAPEGIRLILPGSDPSRIARLTGSARGAHPRRRLHRLPASSQAVHPGHRAHVYRGRRAGPSPPAHPSLTDSGPRASSNLASYLGLGPATRYSGGALGVDQAILGHL